MSQNPKSPTTMELAHALATSVLVLEEKFGLDTRLLTTEEFKKRNEAWEAIQVLAKILREETRPSTSTTSEPSPHSSKATNSNPETTT